MTHPHELAALLVALGEAGIELAPHPTDPTPLRHRPATLDPDLRARLLRHRAAIAGLLANGYGPQGEEAGYVLIERLGVADELAMPTHPGSPAWLVAVAESIMSCCHKATIGVHCGHGAVDRGDCGGGAGEQ